MTAVPLHPPVSRRCQIYLPEVPGGRDLARCINEGTHWEKWPGCNCKDPDEDMCTDDLLTWECDGQHQVSREGEAA